MNLYKYKIFIYYKRPRVQFKVLEDSSWIRIWLKAIWYTKFGWMYFIYFMEKIPTTKLNFDQFKEFILTKADVSPDEWRKGQAVFNVIDKEFGSIAREVQFIDNCDCFYDNDEIERFIMMAYRRYKSC